MPKGSVQSFFYTPKWKTPARLFTFWVKSAECLISAFGQQAGVVMGGLSPLILHCSQNSIAFLHTYGPNIVYSICGRSIFPLKCILNPFFLRNIEFHCLRRTLICIFFPNQNHFSNRFFCLVMSFLKYNKKLPTFLLLNSPRETL